MHARHRGDEREAEAGAGAAAARVEADEAAEGARAVGRGDAGAAVGDDERRAPAVEARRRRSMVEPAGACFSAFSTRFESGEREELVVAAHHEARARPRRRG